MTHEDAGHYAAKHSKNSNLDSHLIRLTPIRPRTAFLCGVPDTAGAERCWHIHCSIGNIVNDLTEKERGHGTNPIA